MKKIFVLLAGLCICGAAAAQPSKGDVILKGSIGYNTVGVMPYTDNSYLYTVTYSEAANLWSIAPQFEYFLGDRTSIGLSGRYMNAWIKSKAVAEVETDKYKNGVSLFFVGPTCNYYIKLAESFYLSINCFIGYAGISQWSSEKYSFSGDDIHEKDKVCAGFGLLTVTPTLNYFINDRWLLTASVGSLAGAYGKFPGSDSDIYYAGANWGNIMFGVGFKF